MVLPVREGQRGREEVRGHRLPWGPAPMSLPAAFGIITRTLDTRTGNTTGPVDTGHPSVPGPLVQPPHCGSDQGLPPQPRRTIARVGGHAIDPATLTWLDHGVCTTCRCLHRSGTSCPFCLHHVGPRTDGPMDLDDPAPIFPSLPAPPVAESAPAHPITGPMPPFTPGLAEVLERPVNTLRHIPAACRVLFAATLGGS